MKVNKKSLGTQKPQKPACKPKESSKKTKLATKTTLSSKNPGCKTKKTKPAAKTTVSSKNPGCENKDSSKKTKTAAKTRVSTKTPLNVSAKKAKKSIEEDSGSNKGDPLAYCREVLEELLSPEKEDLAWPFYEPVDAKLNPDYYKKIKTPIALSNIKEKLNTGEYSSDKEFEQDISLMFHNCQIFNHPDELIVKNAKKLENIFVSRMSKIGSSDAQHLQKSNKQATEERVTVEQSKRDKGKKNKESQSKNGVKRKADVKGILAVKDDPGGNMVGADSEEAEIEPAKKKRRKDKESQSKNEGERKPTASVKGIPNNKDMFGAQLEEADMEPVKKQSKKEKECLEEAEHTLPLTASVLRVPARLRGTAKGLSRRDRQGTLAQGEMPELALPMSQPDMPQDSQSFIAGHFHFQKNQDGVKVPRKKAAALDRDPSYLEESEGSESEGSESEGSESEGSESEGSEFEGSEFEESEDEGENSSEDVESEFYGGESEKSKNNSGDESGDNAENGGHATTRSPPRTPSATNCTGKKINELSDNSLLLCGVCAEMCKRGVSAPCCQARACRSCAVKVVTGTRACWQCLKPIVDTGKLVNDELLRAAVVQFKECGVMDREHWDKLSVTKEPEKGEDGEVQSGVQGNDASITSETTKNQDMVASPAAAAAPPKIVDSSAGEGDAAAIDAKIKSHADRYWKLKSDEAPKQEIKAVLENIRTAKAEFKAATGLDWKLAIEVSQGSGVEEDDLSEKVAAQKQEPKKKVGEESTIRRKRGSSKEIPSLEISEKAKNKSQQVSSCSKDLDEVDKTSGTPIPGTSRRKGTTNSDSNKVLSKMFSSSNKRGHKALTLKGPNSDTPPAKKRRIVDSFVDHDYPYKTVSEVFDTDVLESVLSQDKKRSIEIRLEEAVMQYDAKLDKISSGLELNWLDYKMCTMGVDPTIILAGLDTGVSYKLNKAVTVVNRDNGHLATVNEWNIGIGPKGINKSGGFRLTLGPLKEMENEDVAFHRQLFDEHIEELLKKADEEEQPKTPSKKNDSPKKKKELPTFDEMIYRNLLQSGTSEGIENHMFNAMDKNFFFYFDEASTFFTQLYTSGGPGTAKRTPWLTNLLQFYSSEEARNSKVCKGSKRLPEASIQVFAVAQPIIFFDLFSKDRIDPAGLIDRLTLWVCKPVTMPLRVQKENIQRLPPVVLDVKKLLRTIQFIGSSTPKNEWVLDEEAQEAIFELDEKMIEMERTKGDEDGVLRAMNAKAREKTYRGAAREAAKRIAYGLMDSEIQLDDSVYVPKIITMTDVLKAMAIAHASCYTFLQYKAAVDEKTRGIGNQTAAVNPVAARTFVTDLYDWEKPIMEFTKTYVLVKLVYESERMEFENDKISFDTLMDNKAYLRASSKKRFKQSEELLFFLRSLQYNGLGCVYFGNRPDEKKSITFPRNVYASIKFRPVAEEDDLSEDAKEIMSHLIENVEGFVPFK